MYVYTSSRIVFYVGGHKIYYIEMLYSGKISMADRGTKD
jgi:hypothetical protein